MQETFNRETGSHNIVITAWGELGLAGLAAALWLVAATLLGLWKGRRDPVVLAAGAAFVVAVGYAQVRSQLDNVMLYVAIAILLLALSVHKQRVYEE